MRYRYTVECFTKFKFVSFDLVFTQDFGSLELTPLLQSIRTGNKHEPLDVGSEELLVHVVPASDQMYIEIVHDIVYMYESQLGWPSGRGIRVVQASPPPPPPHPPFARKLNQ